MNDVVGVLLGWGLAWLFGYAAYRRGRTHAFLRVWEEMGDTLEEGLQRLTDAELRDWYEGFDAVRQAVERASDSFSVSDKKPWRPKSPLRRAL